MSEAAVYLVKGRRYRSDDQALQHALADIYGTPERPRCMCVDGGIDMYIARHTQYVVKRMPGSGDKHHPACDAYEPEPGLSGLGAMLGDAVCEKPNDQLELRVAFAFSARGGRQIPAGDGEPASEIKTTRQRMSMRALVHLLFERAGFNRWSPAMAGKRNQAVLNKYLNQAARALTCRNLTVADRLLVPEMFNDREQTAIAQRHLAKLACLHGVGANQTRPMALVLGEFKSAEPCASGFKVLLKHLPDVPLFIDSKGWSKIAKRYADYFAAREARLTAAASVPRIIMCALVYARQEKRFQIESACALLTNAQWIPLDGPHELDLIDALCVMGRRFIKPLRYDAPTAGQFANALLLDTGATSTSLHVVSSFVSVTERAAKDRLLKSLTSPWVWDTSAEMPALPPKE